MGERSQAASAIAGFTAPLAKVVFFPLEMLKVQMIASDGFSKNHLPNYRSPFHALRSIYQANGFLHLYKGCHLIVFSSVAWSVYFTIYESLKKLYSPQFKVEHKELYRLSTASITAMLTWVITNPLWVIKTRVMLQKNSQYWYGELAETIHKIYKLDGVKGFYAGLLPGMILGSSEAMQIYFYESLKERLNTHESTPRTALAGGLSKVMSTCLLYPLQTILVRLQQEQYSESILKRSAEVQSFQQEKFFTGMRNCAKKTYDNTGIKGFYRGLSVQLVRILPSNALFFVIYESTFKFLNDRFVK